MVKELAEQVRHLNRSLYQGLVSKYQHRRNSLVMVKTSDQRRSIDGTTQSNSIYNCTIVSQNAAGSGNFRILYTEERAQEAAFQAAELFGENLTRDLLVTYLSERFQSSKHKDDTYQKFHSIKQSWNRQVQKMSIIATDLLMHRSRLPEDTISDYAFIQQFFASMHPRLRKDVETQ